MDSALVGNAAAGRVSQAGAVAVFCGSRHGNHTAYRDAAQELGKACARAGVELVYGGASVGLMGVAADAALAAGGRVTGVIPGVLLALEVAHPSLTELVVVDSMANRKVAMLERVDAVLCLAGGLGTLDELFEAMTWNQLGLHPRHRQLPIGLVDTLGCWQPTLTTINDAITRGFVPPECLDDFVVDPSAAAVLARLLPSSGILDLDRRSQHG
jgi:uncharacterized protein (TIGR00730 family)